MASESKPRKSRGKDERASNPLPRLFKGGKTQGTFCEEFSQRARLIWDEETPPTVNYTRVAKTLCDSGNLYRDPSDDGGLIETLPCGKLKAITKAADLLPCIVDRMDVFVHRDGKLKGDRISSTHLNAMLKSQSFLNQFRVVDHISATPIYTPEFFLASPGYTDGGPGQRILFTGEPLPIAHDIETISKFLGVMAFATNADRTNAVAASLTVLLRNHWAGGKPIILATASKSHAGKDTIISFATGLQRAVSISYQATNWAFERAFIGAVAKNRDATVVVTENARLEQNTKVIASAFLERLATDPEPQLFSTGTGPAIRVRNNYVLAISTNYGMLSEDILNRGLNIHLQPVGDVAQGATPIGNPKEEFLPANRFRIVAELCGMVERWREAGMPLDTNVRHPFSVWAKTIGGILKVSGFTDFLSNYGVRKTADDPIRRGLAVLGAANPDEWLRPSNWAPLATSLGLIKAIIPKGDQDSDAGRIRGIGTVLSAHEAEILSFDDDDTHVVLRLEKQRKRWGGGAPHFRYRFAKVVEKHKKPKPR